MLATARILCDDILSQEFPIEWIEKEWYVNLSEYNRKPLNQLHIVGLAKNKPERFKLYIVYKTPNTKFVNYYQS